jgi:hypothetical protein
MHERSSVPEPARQISLFCKQPSREMAKSAAEQSGGYLIAGHMTRWARDVTVRWRDAVLLTWRRGPGCQGAMISMVGK